MTNRLADILVWQGGTPCTAMWRGTQLATMLVLLTLVAFPRFASAQPSPLEEELWQAQKRNQEAQAAYYQKQLQEKPLVRHLTDNLAAVAAFTAAFIALITFLFNYRSTLRNQMDTQFYEALKRFGDKDSPTLRSSAAGLIEQMGQLRRLALRRRKPYYETAFDQLTTGYLLEDNRVASNAITQAISVLAQSNRRWAGDQIFSLNDKLLQRFLSVLADFFAAYEVKTVDSIPEAVWRQAASATAYDEAILRETIKNNSESFSKLLNAASLSHEATERTQRRENFLATLQALRPTADHLRTIVDYCGFFLRVKRLKLVLGGPNLRWAPFFGVISVARKYLRRQRIFAGKFLANSALGYADIRRVSLLLVFMPKSTISNARLENVWIWNGDIKSSDLSLSIIVNSHFLNCDFQQSKFDGSYFHRVSLSESNLEKASFRKAHLYKMNLSDAKLRNADLTEAKIHSPPMQTFFQGDFQDVNLSRVDLYNALLVETNLQGANLQGATLRKVTLIDVNMNNAKLYHASISDGVGLSGVNWWKADFSHVDEETHKMDIDIDLIGLLFKRHGHLIPHDIDLKTDVHPSVHDFLAKELHK